MNHVAHGNEESYDPGLAPMPIVAFKRFVAAFHFIFILGLLFSLCLRWRVTGVRLGPLDLLLIAIVAVQIGLYVLFMVLQWKPQSATGWWLAYFGSAYGLWLAEWKLEPALQWTAWAYLGQVFGILRPAYSVPIALIYFLTYFVNSSGFGGFARLNTWQWIGGIATVGSFTLLGLFLYGLTATSSERARLIRKLEAAQRELEAARQRDAELASLRERERLARELHDSLGHGLVTLSVQLEAVQRLYQVDPAKGAELVEQMKALTRGSMEELRRALAGLRAPGLGDRPLLDALRQLCAQPQNGFSAKCDLPAETRPLPPAVAEALWRVAQEGLLNAQKHSGANEARLELAFAPGEARVTVSDHGRGLPPQAESRPGHYGLRGLRERVEGLGGQLKLGQAPGHGTLIEARIPLSS